MTNFIPQGSVQEARVQAITLSATAVGGVEETQQDSVQEAKAHAIKLYTTGLRGLEETQAAFLVHPEWRDA